MITITKEFLQKAPEWKKAGWKIGMVCDTSMLDSTTFNRLALHPPKKPAG